jgi:hypothetical protein
MVLVLSVRPEFCDSLPVPALGTHRGVPLLCLRVLVDHSFLFAVNGYELPGFSTCPKPLYHHIGHALSIRAVLKNHKDRGPWGISRQGFCNRSPRGGPIPQNSGYGGIKPTGSQVCPYRVAMPEPWLHMMRKSHAYTPLNE